MTLDLYILAAGSALTGLIFYCLVGMNIFIKEYADDF
jgi:hypothetical protein